MPSLAAVLDFVLPFMDSYALRDWLVLLGCLVFLVVFISLGARSIYGAEPKIVKQRNDQACCGQQRVGPELNPAGLPAQVVVQVKQDLTIVIDGNTIHNGQ